MRLTNILLKQHNGWLQKIKWKLQGRRKILDTGVAMSLQKRGIVVTDALHHLKKPKFVRPIDPPPPPSTAFENNFFYGNSNVLVYGVPQAQVLTNTVSFNDFPREIENKINSIKLPTPIERSMHQSVLISHLLDAEQAKLQDRKLVMAHKNLLRHKTPREYGISDQRKNFLLSSRLINHCERYYGLGAKHRILNDMHFVLPITIGDRNIQFKIKAETLMSSLRPINALNTAGLDQPQFVNIDPLEPTISLSQLDQPIEEKSIYPIASSSLFPHTVLLDFSKTYVKNIYEQPVNDSQFESRALLKAFAITSAWGRKIYGENAKQLDQPIVLQTIQLDKKRVQFGIFQLNSLEVQGDVKNYWFRKPIMDLYDECTYNEGRPQLLNYNFNIFRTMCVLYGS